MEGGILGAYELLVASSCLCQAVGELESILWMVGPC